MIKRIMNAKATLGILIVILFGLFLWPSLYRYDHLGNIPVKMNRITGRTWKLTANGWELLEKEQPIQPSELRELPEDEKNKIEVISVDLPLSDLPFPSSSSAVLKCYNGSTWKVAQVTLSILLTKKDPNSASKGLLYKYDSKRLKTYVFRFSTNAGAPLSTSSYTCDMGLDGRDYEVLSWKIENIEGIKVE